MRGGGESNDDEQRAPLLQGTRDAAQEEGESDNYVSASYHPGDSVARLHSLHCSQEGYRHALISATGTLGLGCLGRYL